MGGARDEGQAAVELALVLPLVVLLLLTVVQVTLVARDQILVVHAARAGAREAAVGADAAAVRRAVLGSSSGTGGLKSARVAAETSHMGGTVNMVIVRVRYQAATDVPLIGPLLPDLALGAKAAMRTEQHAYQGNYVPETVLQQEPGRSGANPAKGAVRGIVPTI